MPPVDPQVAVLKSVAELPGGDTNRRIVLRGAAVLRMWFGLSRPTSDLDFVVSLNGPATPELQSLKQKMNDALAAGLRRQLPDYDSRREELLGLIHIHLSPNKMLCEHCPMPLPPDGTLTINAATLEDIVAEKMRAMIVQVIKTKDRPQDLFDVADMARKHRATMDYARVAKFLAYKCRVALGPRFVVRRRAFDQAVCARVLRGYEGLRATTGDAFIPFHEAWQELHTLLARCEVAE